MGGAVCLQPSPSLPERVNSIVFEASHGWLKSPVIAEFLETLGPALRDAGLGVSEAPPVKPTAGSLYLINKKRCRNFRKDGHSWKKHADGKTVRERHVKLKVEGTEVVNVYYAHQLEDDAQLGSVPLVRRCYWLLHPDPQKGQADLVLMHYYYTDAEEGSASTGAAETQQQHRQRQSHKRQQQEAPQTSEEQDALLEDIPAGAFDQELLREFGGEAQAPLQQPVAWGLDALTHQGKRARTLAELPLPTVSELESQLLLGDDFPFTLPDLPELAPELSGQGTPTTVDSAREVFAPQSAPSAPSTTGAPQLSAGTGAAAPSLDFDDLVGYEFSLQLFSIEEYSPKEDAAKGGAMVLIAGELLVDATLMPGMPLHVSFGGQEVRAELLRSGSVRCRVPPALRRDADHTVQLCLTLGDGKPVSGAVSFTYRAPAAAVPAAASAGRVTAAQQLPAPALQQWQQQQLSAVGGSADSGSVGLQPSMWPLGGGMLAAEGLPMDLEAEEGSHESGVLLGGVAAIDRLLSQPEALLAVQQPLEQQQLGGVAPAGDVEEVCMEPGLLEPEPMEPGLLELLGDDEAPAVPAGAAGMVLEEPWEAAAQQQQGEGGAGGEAGDREGLEMAWAEEELAAAEPVLAPALAPAPAPGGGGGGGRFGGVVAATALQQLQQQLAPVSRRADLAGVELGELGDLELLLAEIEEAEEQAAFGMAAAPALQPLPQAAGAPMGPAPGAAALARPAPPGELEVGGAMASEGDADGWLLDEVAQLLPVPAAPAMPAPAPAALPLAPVPAPQAAPAAAPAAAVHAAAAAPAPPYAMRFAAPAPVPYGAAEGADGQRLRAAVAQEAVPARWDSSAAERSRVGAGMPPARGTAPAPAFAAAPGAPAPAFAAAPGAPAPAFAAAPAVPAMEAAASAAGAGAGPSWQLFGFRAGLRAPAPAPATLAMAPQSAAISAAAALPPPPPQAAAAPAFAGKGAAGEPAAAASKERLEGAAAAKEESPSELRKMAKKKATPPKPASLGAAASTTTASALAAPVTALGAAASTSAAAPSGRVEAELAVPEQAGVVGSRSRHEAEVEAAAAEANNQLKASIIEDVLERGERLDVLADRSASLTAEASRFQQAAARKSGSPSVLARIRSELLCCVLLPWWCLSATWRGAVWLAGAGSGVWQGLLSVLPFRSRQQQPAGPEAPTPGTEAGGTLRGPSEAPDLAAQGTTSQQACTTSAELADLSPTSPPAVQKPSSPQSSSSGSGGSSGGSSGGKRAEGGLPPTSSSATAAAESSPVREPAGSSEELVRGIGALSIADDPASSTASGDGGGGTASSGAASSGGKAGRTGSELHTAAAEGDVAALRRLLAEGASPGSCDDSGQTALHAAARAGHAAALRELLQAGASVRAMSADGAYPLHLAVVGGHSPALKVLLAAGTDPDQATGYGASALHLAAEHGHVELIRLLVSAGARVDAAAADGSTPLEWAARAGQEAAVQALLKCGAKAAPDIPATTKGPPVKHRAPGGDGAAHATSELVSSTSEAAAAGTGPQDEGSPTGGGSRPSQQGSSTLRSTKSSTVEEDRRKTRLDRVLEIMLINGIPLRDGSSAAGAAAAGAPFIP